MSSISLRGKKKNNILAFVIGLFRFLKRNNMCFLSGSIIFEDDNNRLFNLLTYGQLYNMDDECRKDEALVSSRITMTHKKVFEKPNVKIVKSDEKCFKLNPVQRSFKTINQCKDGKCFKLEFKFDKPIEYLCGDDGNEANMSSKRIIIYYRFEHNNKKYLFFKLEGNPVNSMAHIHKYMFQTRKDTYDKRRENDNDYDEKLERKDLRFYLSLFINELKDLPQSNKTEIYLDIKHNYNPSLRTGKELFIFEELKEFLLNKLIPYYSIQI